MIYLAGTDFSHLTDDELLNGIKALNIPEYIRTKSYGIDVRETLAQMTEMLMQLAYNQGMNPQQAQDFVYEINNKIDKGEVTMSDLTQEVKEALTGGAVAVVGVDAVGTENIKEDAVTTEKIANLSITKEKTDFISVSTNLFDIKKATSGKSLDGATGELADNQYMSTSDFIKIKPNQEYYFKTVQEGRYAFYDENKQFISSTPISSTVGFATTASQSNAKYVKLSTLTSNVNATQLNEGNAELPYEPYYAKLSEDVQLPMENNDVSIVRHASGKFRWLEESKNGAVVSKIEAVYNTNSEIESFVETRDGYTITYQIVKDTNGKVIGITQEKEV